MSYELYYRFFRWAMLTKNPLWEPMMRRIDATYPARPAYVSPSTEGY